MIRLGRGLAHHPVRMIEPARLQDRPSRTPLRDGLDPVSG